MAKTSSARAYSETRALMRTGWTYEAACASSGWRNDTKKDLARIGRMRQSGMSRDAASHTYALLVHVHDNADDTALDTYTNTIMQLSAGQVHLNDVEAMIESRELHLAGQLLDLGYSPADISEASRDISLHTVNAVNELGLTPPLLARLQQAPGRRTPTGTIVKLVHGGLPIELLEHYDIDTVLHARERGLTYDDMSWLTRKGFSLAGANHWWDDDGDLTHVDTATRRVLAALTIRLGDYPHEMQATAAAIADQTWTETFITLLSDSDNDANVARLVATARALENHRGGTPVPEATWTPLTPARPAPRDIVKASDLTSREAHRRSELRRAGITPGWDHVKYWLQTGMSIDNAVQTAHWVGMFETEWSKTISEHTGVNPLPDELPANRWLAAALENGHTLENIRLLASAYHSDGPVGPYVAARVLGLGVSLDTAYQWAAERLDIDTAAIMTAYGVDDKLVTIAAAQDTTIRKRATMIAAMGLNGPLLLTGINSVTHWPARGSKAATTDYLNTLPISRDVIELLGQHNLTTSELVVHSIHEDILESDLDLETRDLILELHTRLGKHADTYTLSHALTGYAAAVVGTPAAKTIEKAPEPASRKSEDVLKAVAKLAALTIKARQKTELQSAARGRAVRVATGPRANTASRSH